MSSHIDRDELAFLMPGRLAYYFRDDPEYMPSSETAARGLFSLIADAVKWVIEIPHRRAVLDELASLTDRELADIGLNRMELGDVFGRGVTTVRNSERDLLAASGSLST